MREDWPIVVFTLLIIGAIIGAFWVAVIDDRQWKSYAADHHCHVVGTKDAQTEIGITMNGKMVTTTVPSQTIYLCDGNEIRIR